MSRLAQAVQRGVTELRKQQRGRGRGASMADDNEVDLSGFEADPAEISADAIPGSEATESETTADEGAAAMATKKSRKGAKKAKKEKKAPTPKKAANGRRGREVSGALKSVTATGKYYIQFKFEEGTITLRVQPSQSDMTVKAFKALI